NRPASPADTTPAPQSRASGAATDPAGSPPASRRAGARHRRPARGPPGRDLWSAGSSPAPGSTATAARPAAGSGQQAALPSRAHRASARGDGQLAVDPFDMAFDGIAGNGQLFGDFPVAQAAGNPF